LGNPPVRIKRIRRQLIVASSCRIVPRMRTVVSVTLGLLLICSGVGAQPATDVHWVGTWAAAAAWRSPLATLSTTVVPLTPATAIAPAPPAGAPPPPPWPKNQTLRQVVHTSVGGRRARVVLTNVYGTLPLPIADLAVDLFSPLDTTTWPSALTMHTGANQTSYLSEQGNFVGRSSFTVADTTTSWFFLSRVEVEVPRTANAIVAIGDSITDGARSTRDTNSRYPDQLVRRLKAAGRMLPMLNGGIGGNRLLSEANSNFGINLLARWDRDVLAVSGARYVILLEGINDIGMGVGPHPPSADELITAHQQVIERAHTDGLLIYGATLTPFEGAAYFTAAGEATRQAVNAWIRTSKAYDAVVDFDVAIRDPQHPTRFLPAYNSGDNLHPNDAGYKAMADAIDLSLFTR
jgi:lysophospholipase L1-like esterase